MSTWEERMQAEKACRVELRKRNIGGTAEFRKWAVKNHPDKGGKLKVFQKVSGCVDLMFKATEVESAYRPSTSYSQPTYTSTPKRPKSRSKAPPETDYFWSAFEEYEVDEDFLYGRNGRAPPKRYGPSEGGKYSRRRAPPEEYEPRKTRRKYERYGFRGAPMHDPDGTDWEEFDAYVREHMGTQVRRAREAEERRARQKRERERERGKDRAKGKERETRRGTSPQQWQGPPNPYQDPDAAGRPSDARPRQGQGARANWEREGEFREALRRLKRMFSFQERDQGEGISWRHRISKPQIVFAVAQLTCMQSVFLSTAFRRF